MFKKYVVDSSVIIKWLNPTNEVRVDIADKILEDAQRGKLQLITSDLAKYEVGNVLLVHKKLSAKDAEKTFTNFYNLPIEFVSTNEELALKIYLTANHATNNGKVKITYYDSAFVALAKQENATLVTDNPKHQAKIKGVKVIPLEKYQ